MAAGRNLEVPLNKPQVKSKTNWFGIILALFAGIQQFAPVIQAEISPSSYNILLFGVGIAVVVLRQVTKGPVGK